MKRAFVIGDPIKHSRSPVIHQHWISQHGLDARYEAIHVKPSELGNFMALVRHGDFAGGNVTLPHKETIKTLLTKITSTARAIGAINTIYRDKDGGDLAGDNTDAYGFSANLDDHAPKWRDGTKALILGAGGAARAIVYAMVDVGYTDIVIVNRTAEKADSLAKEFGKACRASSFDQLPTELPEADCLVNTTSLGMNGQPSLEIDLSSAQSNLVVNDIVYAPLETALLEQARKRGMIPVDGLGMLLHQAVPGFERWFGEQPVVDAELRDLVISDLNGDR